MGDTEYYAALIPAMAQARLAGLLPSRSVDVLDLTPSAYRPMAYLRDGSPTGLVRSNLDRTDVGSDTAAIATGTMLSASLYLHAGDVVTNLTFTSGATAGASLTHWFFALYDTQTTPALISQTADQVAAAWAANTSKTLALAAPYMALTSGFHQASVSVTASTVPSLIGITVLSKASSGVVSGQVVLAQTSGSALGATAPATITGASTATQVPYVVAT